MNSIYEELEAILQTGDSGKMLDRLGSELRSRQDYHGLFYALVLKRRHDLGLPAVQANKNEEIPPDLQRPYEEGIREAARHVGHLYLQEGDLAAAWPFFRMIGEPSAVADAIEKADTEDSEKCQQVVEIALHEGVHPKKGFEILLQRYGICNAITTLSQELPFSPEVREHCVRQLIRALHGELRERLAADLAHRGEEAPESATVRDLLQRLHWSSEEEIYHVDVSHLGATVQFSMSLPLCEELNLAIELCEYGQRLSPRLQGNSDEPFENQYRDYHIYLKTLAGQDVEEGLAHFRAKAEAADPEQVGTYPAEVLVTLLARAGRNREAAAAFSRYLAQADVRRLSCPTLQDLCVKLGDYQPLVDVSLRRGDLVNYVAGLLASAPATKK